MRGEPAGVMPLQQTPQAPILVASLMGLGMECGALMKLDLVGSAEPWPDELRNPDRPTGNVLSRTIQPGFLFSSHQPAACLSQGMNPLA